MTIRAHLHADMLDSGTPDSETGQRAAARRALRWDTSGRVADGMAANVTIHNISAAGLLIETAWELAVGERLAIDLPEAGRAEAVIVWRSENLYGCAFAQSLGKAALAAAQLRAGSMPDTGSPAFPSPASRDAIGPGFGQKINRLRRERGLTLADVAAALGVSKPTVWAWEKGKARPVPERLGAIAAALGVRLEDLHDTGTGDAAANALIAACRTQIADALNIAPAAVRIMIEL